MKKGLLVILIVALIPIGVILFTSLGGAQALANVFSPKVVQAEIVSPVTGKMPPVVASTEINVSGRLTPAKRMDLTFQTEGVIAEILVKEGETVKEGQVLARLREERELRLAVSRSKLEVMNAEKALNDLYKNAPTTAAQLNYDIVQARKDLDKAEKRRTSMDYPKATQKKMDDAYKDYLAAQGVLKQMEDYYAGSEDKAIRDAFRDATKERDRLLGIYNYLTSAYTNLEIAEAEANVQLLRSKLESLQNKYTIYVEGPDPDEEKIAQAKLAIAKAELANAEEQFADMELRAPFSGTVVTLNVEEGQPISSADNILLLADFTRWHIQTEDLTELGVTRIHEGASATVKFDALPDAIFDGKVVAIKNIGEDKKGDITYTATIEILNSDSRLRWNMTSPIVIKTE